MVQRITDLGGLHGYLSRAEMPLLSVCILICLSLSAVSWVEAAVPISNKESQHACAPYYLVDTGSISASQVMPLK